MNWVDIVIVVIIGLSTIYSLFRGFIKEVFSLLAIVVSVFAAISFHDRAVAILHNEIFSFIVVLFVVFIAVILVGRLLRKFIKAIELGWADKLGGAAFGFVKGYIIIAVVLMLLNTFYKGSQDILSDSVFTPKILDTVKRYTELMPEDLKENFEKNLDHLKKLIKEKRRFI